MKKLKRYAIMLDKWASPLFINAYTEANAIKRALDLFPVCDCGCGEESHFVSLEQLR